MIRISVLLVSAVVVCALALTDSAQVWSARQAAQTTFPPGAVVALQGTVHLWIADQNGVLHWGGDTRALQGQMIDWNTRISVSLETLRTLRLGDPLLSAGLLKDGTPIYLVKWETTDAVPRLLHIQCIRDVEVFGINSDNYGKFVLDRDQWEARFRIPASTLQRGELPTTDPTCSSPGGPTPTPMPAAAHPVIPLASDALPRLEGTLRAHGLTQASINADRPTTLALASAPPVVQAAPLTLTPSQNLPDLSRSNVNLPIGVLLVNRGVSGDGQRLDPGVYLVKVRAGRVYFVDTDNNELQPGLTLDARRLTTTLPAPRTTITYRDVCFSWAQVQVCTQTQPISALMGDERRYLQDSIGAARDALIGRGLFRGDVNMGATISEAEGVTAVSRQRANVIAAPAVDLPNITSSGPAPAGAWVGIIVVDTPVDLPGHPPIPSGQYAVQSTGNSAQTNLLASDGRPAIVVPSNSIEVRGASGGVNEGLAIIANLCFSGEGDFPLCLLFEPR
jgi:hypothetical protein